MLFMQLDLFFLAWNSIIDHARLGIVSFCTFPLFYVKRDAQINELQKRYNGLTPVIEFQNPEVSVEPNAERNGVSENMLGRDVRLDSALRDFSKFVVSPLLKT